MPKSQVLNNSMLVLSVLPAVSIWLGASALSGCEVDLAAVLDAVPNEADDVIYGTDNRQDVYAHPDATLRARAMESTVALMTLGVVNASNPNNVTFLSSTLKSVYGLCATERFLNDPTPAFCSGTLIDDDLVMTAGHCVTNQTDCNNTDIVFRYYATAARTLRTVTTSDIFRCRNIVVRQQGTISGQLLDYAVIRLDRAATPRFAPAPLRIHTRATLGDGRRLAIVGSPYGVPFKIDAGGWVRDGRAPVSDYFVDNLDTFPGNSGSGVYELGSYTVAGVHVRGDSTNFVWDAANACRTLRVCSDNGCTGQDATYVQPAIDDFCRVATSTRLCGVPVASVQDLGLPTGDPGWRIVGVGDFDGDGKSDLVWRRSNDTGEARIWLVDGGTLKADLGLPEGDPGWHVIGVQDFNSDGKSDVVWRRLDESGEVRVWLMSSASLIADVPMPTGDRGWRVVGAGDFNSNGRSDLVWRRTNDTLEARIWLLGLPAGL
jgi:hypothetical protein